MNIHGTPLRAHLLKLNIAGDQVDLTQYLDQHVITGAFKMIFREMPEPLLTFDLYKNFLGAAGMLA